MISVAPFHTQQLFPAYALFMHIQFKSIRIKRFRSFLDQTCFEFDFAGQGLYFLKGKNKTQSTLGSNGSGKSSILDALLWCLYGKTVQGLKNPDIVPWTGKGATEVEITLKIDKETHVIRRTVGPNKLSIDGQEAGQEYVSKLISIPFEIIPYTIILGQRQPLFFDLTASEKLKLFSESLNLERWEDRSKHAADMCDSLEKEIDAKKIEISLWNREIEDLSQNTVALKQKSVQWEDERQQKLESKEVNKAELQKKIASVMTERDTADLKLDSARTELKALSPALEKIRADERLMGRQAASLDNQAISAVSKINELEVLLKSIGQEICPTCEQPIESKNQQKKIQDNIKQQIKDIKLAKLIKERDTCMLNYDTLLKQLNIQVAAQKVFEDDINDANDVLDRLIPKIATWEAEIKALDKMSQEYEAQSNPYSEQVQTSRKKISILQTMIAQSDKTLISKGEYFERAKFWIKGFKDIKIYTLEQVLQELEINTNSLIEESGLLGWQIKYDMERETKAGTVARGLNIVVLSPNNKLPVKWESWSGGEAQRLRLIGTAALSSVLLNHIGVSTNLEIYDEPTESLSKEGISDLVGLLAQRAKDTKRSIWMIDHHTIESSHFVDTVTVTKDKTGSHIL
jgi:DNA repair exonuclease SbcCD ATPase subunit